MLTERNLKNKLCTWSSKGWKHAMIINNRLIVGTYVMHMGNQDILVYHENSIFYLIFPLREKELMSIRNSTNDIEYVQPVIFEI